MKYYLLFIILLFSIDATLVAQIPSYIVQDSLVAWYPFNGNANDETGNGNNGIVYGAILTADKDGNENSAYSFDGVDDYIEIVNYSEHFERIEEEITISSWFLDKKEGSSTIVARRNFTSNPTGERHHFQLGVIGDNQLLYSSYNNTDLTKYNIQPRTAEKIFSDSVWNHIAITFSVLDSSKFKMYLNGKIIHDEKFPGQMLSPNQHWINIGRTHRSGGQPFSNEFNGKIDEVAIWNRALSDNEIRNIYYEGNPPVIPSYIPQDSLVAWYPFNGNASDESGNGNNGTVNGATLTTDKDGNENNAYSFDGVDDYIDVGNGESLNPTDSIAIQVWIYPKSYENNKHVISKGSHTNLFYRAYSIHSPYEDSLWTSFITVDNTELTVKSNTIAELNKWTHLLLQFDGQFIEFYINGILDKRITANNGGTGKINLVQNEPLYFGSHKPSNVDYYFDGKINDIAIWRRTLMDKEIQGLYDQGKNKFNNYSITLDTLQVRKDSSFTVSVHSSEITSADSIESYQFVLPLSDGLTYTGYTTDGTHSTDGFISVNETDSTLNLAFASNVNLSGTKPLIHLNLDGVKAKDYYFTPEKVFYNNKAIPGVFGGLVGVVKKIGDVDNDGTIFAFDAAKALRYSVGLDALPKLDPLPWEYWRQGTADVNGDGMVLAVDAADILKYVVGTIEEFTSVKVKRINPSVEVIARDGNLYFDSENNGLFGINVHLKVDQTISYGDPATPEGLMSAVNATQEHLKIGVASSEDITGRFLTIPITQYSGGDELGITYYINNVRTEYKVDMTEAMTDINEGLSVLPQQYELLQNYPNPFNPRTQIRYTIPVASQVRLEVYNSVGQKVMMLVDGQQLAGRHQVSFDASGLSSGVYLYKLSTPGFLQTKKMLLIK